MCKHPYIKEINGVLTPLPCGRCIECYNSYERSWDFRLQQESKNFMRFWFITLTYNDEHLPTMRIGDTEQSCVFVSEVQGFLKRLRKNTGMYCKYFAVGEYGGKYNRSHYHILLFTDYFANVHQCYVETLLAWQGRGYVYAKYGKKEQFHYLTKYVNKLDARPHLVKPFKLMSKGLGLSFLSPSMVDYYMTNPHRTAFDTDGRTVPLPRYYVKKLDEMSIGGFHGLKFSEFTNLLNHVEIPSTNLKWYHEYFCQNYDELRELFIENELENQYITKFLDPNVNMVFDWFLSSNESTKHDLWLAQERLDKVKLKNCCNEMTQAIGNDYILHKSDLDFV